MPLLCALPGPDGPFDPDIILYLQTTGRSAEFDDTDIKRQTENQPFLLASTDDHGPSELSQAGREATLELEEPEADVSLSSETWFALRFSHGAKTSRGIVLGRDLQADLVLDEVTDSRYISRFHVAFTFDQQNRPIVRDLGSRSCTSVVYHAEDTAQPRRNFQWLLQTPSGLHDDEKSWPKVTMAKTVEFEIVVPPHDITSPDYIDRVTKFRKGTMNHAELLALLDLQNGIDTKIHTGTQTPPQPQEPVFVKRELGKGSFGVATYAWNVSTGEECVWKEPVAKKQGVKFDIASWRREAKILEHISHEHIVAYQGSTFTDGELPRLQFEYMPGGKLSDCENASRSENLQVLCQLLSALEYLHGLDPPIGHRDIKPDNILVLYRHSEGICVKFADFGLSKMATTMQTACGTPLWLAPEVHDKFDGTESVRGSTYTTAVDVWSLGLVIASQECGLPDWEPKYNDCGREWINAVLNHVGYYRSKGNELLDFVMNMMLVRNPRRRGTAAQCYEKALQLSNLYHATNKKCGEMILPSCEEPDHDPVTGTPSFYAATEGSASGSDIFNNDPVDGDDEDDDDDDNDDDDDDDDDEDNDCTEDALDPSQTVAAQDIGEYEVDSISTRDGYQLDSGLLKPGYPDASLIGKLGERGSSFFDSLFNPSSFEWSESLTVPARRSQLPAKGTSATLQQLNLTAGHQDVQIFDADKSMSTNRHVEQGTRPLMETAYKCDAQASVIDKPITNCPSPPYISSQLKRSRTDRSIAAILERELANAPELGVDIFDPGYRPPGEPPSYKRQK